MGDNMINTVTGPIKKEELEVTLSHEHLAWDYRAPWLLYHYKIYNDEDIKKLFNKLLPVFTSLYHSGCRTIAEASPPRGGQNLKLMKMLSIESGIQIIPNTGMPFKRYVYEIHKSFNEEELAQRWIKDFEDGLDRLDSVVIRPGQIKLLLGDDEDVYLSKIDKKILKAAVIASKATGMPVHCHLMRSNSFLEAIDVLEEENFNLSKFLWAHAGNEANMDVIDLAYSKGIWLGFDQIRREDYSKYYSLIKKAIQRGYTDKILLSQDYDFYEEATEAGGTESCVSFFTDFLPFCEERGLSSDVILGILKRNTANFFDI